MYCLKCNYQYKDTAIFCPNCGEPTHNYRKDRVRAILDRGPGRFFCEQCGTQLEGGERFCPECGSAVEDHRCLGCGEDLPRGSRFCEICGTERGKKPVITDPSAPRISPAGEASYPHPYHQLGGFLQFIVVMGYIGGVGSIISLLASDFRYLQVMQLVSRWGIGISLGGFTFLIVILNIVMVVAMIMLFQWLRMIRQKDPLFLRYFQIYGCVAIGMNFIVGIIANNTVNSMISSYSYYSYGEYSGMNPFSGGILYAILMAGFGALGLFLMSMYYSRSVRVRTYMGSDEYLRKSLFNTKTPSPIPADRQPYTGQL